MKYPLALTSLALMLCACGAQDIATDDNTPAGKRMPVEWTAEQTGTDDNGAPEMALILRVAGNDQELFRTSCSGTTSTDVEEIEGSIASIRCWWAGGGDEYGVFVGEAEQLFVRHRTVDEEAGFGPWEDAMPEPR